MSRILHNNQEKPIWDLKMGGDIGGGGGERKDSIGGGTTVHLELCKLCISGISSNTGIRNYIVSLYI